MLGIAHRRAIPLRMQHRSDSSSRSSSRASSNPAPKQREKTLYGRNACRAFFAHHPNAIKRVFFNRDTSDLFADLAKYCASEKRPYRQVENEEMVKLTKSHHHEGICMVVRLWSIDNFEQYLSKTQPTRACILALEGVENPHNLGAIMRTAAHFNVDAILMENAQLLQSGAALRTAEGGGSEITPLQCDNLPEALKTFREKFGYQVITTSSKGGKALFKAPLPERCIFVIGSEAHGLSQDALAIGDWMVKIPGSDKVDSLNAATATALLLAEYWRSYR